MEKIEHIWTVICSNSTTDQQTNNMSLFNLVENFSVVVKNKDNSEIEKDKKIIIPFGQEVVSRFRRKVIGDDLVFEMRIDFVNSLGEVTEGKEIKTMSFPKKFSNMRIIDKIDNLPVTNSGLYKFSIKIREVGETKFEEVGVAPLEVTIKIE